MEHDVRQTVGEDDRRVDVLVGALVLLATLAVYGITIAPNVSFWDSGEFIATSYVLGIPHPPGTPLYVLLGRVFSIVPGLPVATKVNLLSAVPGALAVFCLYWVLLPLSARFLREEERSSARWRARLGAAIGALLAGFGSTCWTNATEAEVYSLSIFVVAFSLWILIRWHDRGEPEKDRRPLLLAAYLLSLSIGIHLGTYLALPSFVFLVLLVDRRAFLDIRFLSFVLFFTLLGVTVHFYLPIRSALNPSIDEANPETRQALMDFLLRRQYKPMNPFVRQASWAFQFGMFWDYFRDQYGRFLPLLGVVGMFAHYRADRKTFPAYALLFLLTSFFLIFYMNFTDHEVRDRDYFFAPAFFLWGGWMGLGATAILLWIRRAPGRIAAAAPAAGAIAAVLLLLVPVAALAMHFHTHDRRGNYIANDYAWNILTSLGRDAILFTNGDNDTFPLWYLQEVEGVRKDIRVVNLALLNTQWYIWQLKHLEPKVPLSYTDEEIQDLEPFRKRDGAIVYVKDRAVVNIVRANQWERPIYFAVTVAELMGLDKQKRLRLEGLVWRLSEKEETTVVDVEKCTENLYEHYRYRGILDDDGNLDERVAKNVNQRKLITNYSAAFSRLAIQQRNDGNYDDAIRNMEMAGRISTGYRVYEALMGPLYVEAERYEEAEAFFQKRMAEGPESLSPYLGLAFIRERQGEREEAERLYEEGIRIAPRVQDSYLGLVRLRIGSGDIEGARRALVEWLAVRPDDEQARAQLGELDRLIQAARDTVSRRRSN